MWAKFGKYTANGLYLDNTNNLSEAFNKQLKDEILPSLNLG